MNQQHQPLDFATLCMKVERTPTVSARQHYVTNILANRSTSQHDRREVLHFIARRPDLFVPYAETSLDPIENEIARKHNGPDARGDFRSWVQIKFAS